MAIQIGHLIEAQHYNELALEINRLFSDNTNDLYWDSSGLILNTTAAGGGEIAGQTPRLLNPIPVSGDYIVVIVNNTTLNSTQYSINYGTGFITFLIPISPNVELKVFNRQLHIFGWGQQESVYPISAGNAIFSDEAQLQSYIEANTNNLIDKVNIMEDRIGGPSELTRLARGNLIRATDKLIIQSVINDDVLAGDNYWQNDIATLLPNFESFQRVSSWDNILQGEWRYTWDSYDSFRYFFNSGCDLRLYLEITGNLMDQGVWNWNQVITDMGSLVLNYNTTSQTGINGISNNLGTYELSNFYQQIFMSSSPSNPRISGDYGDYGDYSEYGAFTDLRIIWDARAQPNQPVQDQFSIDIRATMNDWVGDQNLNTTVNGTTTFYSGYKLADNIVNNSATFSMTDHAPIISIIDDFESGNDS